MTSAELNDMDARLVSIASKPDMSQEDARYAMSCALALMREVKMAHFQQHGPDYIEQMGALIRTHAQKEAK